MTGDELVELKRHAHEIPDCPGLARRIQRHTGKGPLIMSGHELDWLVAVLDTVLHDPNGYPCVDYELMRIDYVPVTDERYGTCQRLYKRLSHESSRLFQIVKKKHAALRRPREAGNSQAVKSDRPKSKLEAVFSKRGCPAVAQRINRGYTIFYEDKAVSRIRERSGRWEVLWWSHRDKWESIGDLGGMSFNRIEQAAEYVLEDPMGIFWR